MAAASISAALTSLLNSLHTQLQAQTQLLPTLHAQLGLPSTALEEELDGLRNQLIQTVEGQVNLRQKEVETWLERCNSVELECLRYSSALGANTKSVESNISELKKELVLPRRFELVSEHQEKLRQLYHTKLEQLMSLTDRLQSLTRTLGADFYTRDITEPIIAAGDDPNDPDANSDVSQERFSKLEKELVRGKAEVTKRLNQLSAIFVQLDWLYSELGMIPPAPDVLPSLSQSCSTHFLTLSSSTREQLSASHSSPSDLFLVSTPTPAGRNGRLAPLFLGHEVGTIRDADYYRTFSNFVVRLELAEEEGIQNYQTVPIGLENVEPTNELLSWAAELQRSLESVKRKREAHIQTMYDQLEGLWKRLGVVEADMDGFVDAHRGSTEQVVQAYEEELERMIELKRERMGQFIESAREEIVKFWDDLLVSEDERADFAPFFDDEHTEELLNIHEHEIRRLKEEKRQKAPLLASIKKYFDICEEEKELAAAASDQTRLTGRGRDPGRLLREEKMRKRVQKEKPRLERDLLVSIPAWENDTGKPLLVHGQSMLQMLMETVTAQDQENKRKPVRAGSVPPRATTPISSTTKTGTVTPAVRPGAISHSVPNKRRKLEAASSTHHRQASGGKRNGNSSQSSRVPLGVHRGGNEKENKASPIKRLARIASAPHGSVSRPVPHAMAIPKLGTQHHTLGHGRLPSVHVEGMKTTSRTISEDYKARYVSGSSRYPAQDMMKKASRARRESFKPRPSEDIVSIELREVWHGPAETLKEEDERC